MTPEEQINIQNMFDRWFLLPEFAGLKDEIEKFTAKQEWEDFIEKNFVENGKISRRTFDGAKHHLVNWFWHAYLDYREKRNWNN